MHYTFLPGKLFIDCLGKKRTLAYVTHRNVHAVCTEDAIRKTMPFGKCNKYKFNRLLSLLRNRTYTISRSMAIDIAVLVYYCILYLIILFLLIFY